MTSVAQLVRTSEAHLAAASGAPRPLLPSALRATNASAGAGNADVIELYPARTAPAATGTPGSPDQFAPTEIAGDGPATRMPAWEDAQTVERISGIARSVAQGAVEVLAGSRPLQQMAKWLDPENFERLQLRANLVRCISTAPGVRGSGEPRSAHRHVVVRSARVCAVQEGVYEASVVAFDQKRVRAVALRIEQRRGSWRVTALEIG